MQRLFLPLGLTLAILTSACGSETSEAAENLKGAANSAMEKAQGALGDMGNMDFKSMDPAKLKETASGFLENAGSMLSNLKDSEGAKKAVSTLSPILEKLSAAKATLGDKVDFASLKDTWAGIKAKLPSGEGIQEALKPLIEKMGNLFG